MRSKIDFYNCTDSIGSCVKCVALTQRRMALSFEIHRSIFYTEYGSRSLSLLLIIEHRGNQILYKVTSLHTHHVFFTKSTKRRLVNSTHHENHRAVSAVFTLYRTVAGKKEEEVSQDVVSESKTSRNQLMVWPEETSLKTPGMSEIRTNVRLCDGNVRKRKPYRL